MKAHYAIGYGRCVCGGPDPCPKSIPYSFWQEVALYYNNLLLKLGMHQNAKHESLSMYDDISSLACTIPSCGRRFELEMKGKK
jgi:hypothetical protein